MKFLVTGAAGFIGYHVSKRLLLDGHQVVGIDNLNNYYDVSLKNDRLNNLRTYNSFYFYKIDLIDQQSINSLFINEKFNRVIHLGAQVGVRYSLDNPLAYGNANLIGHINILEGCRHTKVEHLLYASSSSVYGLNNKLPFSTENMVDHPISLYAATKKANELMAHTYSHLYQLPTTGLRFFTVYGPWGRPDMVLFKFTQAMLSNKHIEIYNYGNMSRDFTYVDDIVEVIIRLQDIIPMANPNWKMETGSIAASSAPYNIYNIGSGQPIKLTKCIQLLEDILGVQSKKKLLPIQHGDMLETSADIQMLYRLIGFKPQISIAEGIKYFVDWYIEYYKCKYNEKYFNFKF